MNKSILIILCFGFLMSCNKDNYWTAKNKSDFKNSCELALNKSLQESGVDVMEQLGTTVAALCDCQLEKTMVKYPDAAPDISQIKETGDAMATECISELRN